MKPTGQAPATVSITSGKGGVGKTSLAVNLAFALADMHRKVLLVDGDLGLANVDVMLRLKPAKTIEDVLLQGQDPHCALTRISDHLAVLPGSSGVPAMVAPGSEKRSQLTDFLTCVMAGFDVVLLDTAAGIGDDVMWFNTFARHTVIVVSPEPTSLTDAYAVIKILAGQYGRNDFKLVLNFIENAEQGRALFQTLHQAAQRFLNLDPKLLGTVVRDPKVNQAVIAQTPFLHNTPGCPAAASVRQLARAVGALAADPAV